MVSRYTTDEVTRSVVTSSTLPDTAHPYFATVVPSAEKADEVFDVDVLPEHARSDWNSIRYENEFVAVFLTDINVLPEKDASGSEPATSIEGDSFVFSIPVVADEERYRDRIYTVLEKWSLNGGQKPNNAAVQLRYPDRT